MGLKSEISWKRVTEEGIKIQVYAHLIGDRWTFFHRQKRFDQWQQVEEPPLEDWLELLDAVQRRIARRLMDPQAGPRLRKVILERFPSAELE